MRRKLLSLLTAICVASAILSPTKLFATPGYTAMTKQTNKNQNKTGSRSASPAAPDFAYPKTILKSEPASLERALSGGNDIAALRSLINIDLAATAISSDSADNVLSLIRTSRQRMRTLQGKALTSLLEASILMDIYNSSSYKFDNREIPLLPYPAEVELWSGKQFKTRIAQLVDEALTPEAELFASPLKNYQSVVIASDETLRYYPSLYDFVATKSIELLMNCSDFRSTIPLARLCSLDIFLTTPLFCSANVIANRILDIYATLLRHYADNAACRINYDLHRIDFTAENVYNPGNTKAYDSPYEETVDNETDADGQYATSVSQRTVDLYRNLYDRNADSEYSGDILMHMADKCSLRDYGWLLDKMESNLRRFRNYAHYNDLKKDVGELKKKSLVLSAPASAYPGVPFKVTVTATNMQTVELKVYHTSDISDRDGDVKIEKLKTATPAGIFTLKLRADKLPMTFAADTMLSLPKPGLYAIVPSFTNGETPRFVRNIRCTRLGISALSDSATVFITTDARSGQPVTAGVYSIDYRSNKQKIGTTADNGLLAVSNLKNSSNNYKAEKGSDHFSESLYVYSGSGFRSAKTEGSVNIITDLAIYHPGDTLRFCAVASETNPKRISRPCRNVALSAMLRNASGETIDTIKGTTDAFGRFSGEFAIPRQCLTGNFAIVVLSKADDQSDTRLRGSATVMVSDYKLPDFMVVMNPAQIGSPTKGAATLTGRVMTYSGFPMSDCRVELRVSCGGIGWLWRPSNPVIFHTAEAATDADGRFSFELDSALLANSPFPGGLFEAVVTATSTIGESHDQSVGFSLHDPYQMSFGPFHNIDLTKNNGIVRLPLHIDGPDGSAPDKRVRYRLRNSANEVVAEGEVTPASSNADWHNIASGTYSLTLTPIDFEAGEQRIRTVTLYRQDDTAAPSPDILWTPINEMMFGDDDEAVVFFSTQPDTCHILATVSASGKILSQQWLTLASGMHRFTAHIPSEYATAKVTLLTMNNFTTATAEVSLTRESSVNKLVIRRESFRDRIIPGATETWRVSVGVENAAHGTTPASSAVIMNMYNKALDALEPFRGMRLRLNMPWEKTLSLYKNDNSTYSQTFGTSPYFSHFDIDQPEWQLFRQSLYNGFSNVYYSTRKLYKSSRATDDFADKYVATGNMMAEEAVMDMAMPMMAAGANVDNGARAESAGAVDEAKGETHAGRNDKETEFSYRQGEVPLAFFTPMLQTGVDGQLEFTFTVPNANATWVWNMLAYDEAMLWGVDTAESLAAKPVMVIPNLPRFVRLGDNVSIKAMVANNSETKENVETVIEIFNPADGQIVGRHAQTDAIEPMSSVTVSVELDATTGPLLGYRIRSAATNFADGEQALIAVLPASDPVIESETFYMAPDDKRLDIRLPELPSDAVTTLQFCENPLWMVVAALPGIADDSSMSTPADAARAIYGAAIADNLLRRYPMVAEALTTWRRSDKTNHSMLESMLSKNQDLKMVLLSATPWMISAKNDTERMTRLSLLFDHENIENVYARATALLSKLSTPAGGWRWVEFADEPSVWATSSALSYFGHLKALGYMPIEKSQLSNMIGAAVAYVDKETVKDYKKYPNSSYTNYVFMRGDFPDIERSADVKKIFEKTVADIAAHWKEYSLPMKAVGAIVLSREGRMATARDIMESADQFAETSPTKGMWWPSIADNWFMAYNDLGITALILEAYEATGAPTTKIDAIRQWLILQKEARDWGADASTSTVIADILRSSQRWLTPSGGKTEITVNGHKVDVSAADRYSGSIRADISEMNPSGGNLIIRKKTDAPSWGSVISRFTRQMDRIEAVGCDDLKIEKNMYRAIADSAEVRWEVIDGALTTADRVRIELVLHVERELDYVAIVDNRAACFEPIEQLPAPMWQEGICFYRENRDAATNFFITRLPKGTYRLAYEMFVNNAGDFASGIATVQSQYAPQFVAHSSGTRVTVN